MTLGKTRLQSFLEDEVISHEEEKGVKLTEEQRFYAIKGLEYYINDYLSEQIPEQIDNQINI